jgi:dihydroorotase
MWGRIAQVPDLKVIMEHITTADAVEFVRSGPEGRLAATITPQHILLNRNSLFQVAPSLATHTLSPACKQHM